MTGLYPARLGLEKIDLTAILFKNISREDFRTGDTKINKYLRFSLEDKITSFIEYHTIRIRSSCSAKHGDSEGVTAYDSYKLLGRVRTTLTGPLLDNLTSK